ncbi:MAG: 4'-phosphopantetheinyl transferase superfamily protein [Desulfobacterales bacterium]
MIHRFPERKRKLPPNERVVCLSRHARKALAVSAASSGVVLGELIKDADGVPIPSNGCYWCITHKPSFVGGVVSADPVGLDLEEIKPCHPGLFRKVAIEAEWELSNAGPYVTFYRFWTAKEALIKLHGTGLRDMLNCRVTHIPDDRRLALRYNSLLFEVEHVYFNGHIAAIIPGNPPVHWQLPDGMS